MVWTLTVCLDGAAMTLWYNFGSYERADVMILYSMGFDRRVQIGLYRCRRYDIVLYNFSLAFEVAFLCRTVRLRTCDYILEC